MSAQETQLPPVTSPKATVTGIFAATDFAPGDLIADRFRVVRLLGMGAMGVVYQAEDTQLGVPVALKLLRPELASKPEAFDRFRHELLLARQVSSPHVVRIHDLVQHQGAWLISMDYVAGESLEDLLMREKRLPPERALQITRQLALGLAAAHHKGVVHRDLKPANVLLNEQGDALITDFGVARSMGATRLTQSGMVVGTPAYLSPEQAQAAPIDGRSDLYTLGLILYEMLSGELPFGQGTGSEMLVQRILRSAPSVRTQAPATPQWIADLLAALLLPKRDERISTAEELVTAIDRRLPPRGHSRRVRWRRLRAWLPAAAALVIAGLALVAGGRLWDKRPSVPEPGVELTLMPFDGDARDETTRAWLRGAGILLASELSETRPTANAERSGRTIAQLGFDADNWRRNRAQVFAALPSEYWLELDATTPEAWRLLLWQPGRTEASLLATIPARGTPAADQLVMLQDAVAKRFPSGARVRRMDLAAVSGPALVALGDPEPADPVAADAPGVLLAIACQRRLESLELRGERALAQVQARACLDRLGPLAEPPLQRDLRAHVLALLILEEAPAALSLSARLDLQDGTAVHLRARALADTDDLAGAEQLMTAWAGQDTGDGRAWFQAGKFAILRGDAQRAVDDYLVRAQVLANRQDDTLLRAEVANALGIGFRRLGQLSAAADSYRQAIALHERAGNVRGRATSLHNLASVLSTLGEFDASETALLAAEALIRPMGDLKALADLRLDFGVLAEERGDFPAALAAYREALSLHLQGSDPDAVADSLLSVGFAYYQMGDFVNAELHWQQADQRSRDAGDLFGMVRAQQSLGLAYAARGDFAKARASFQQSLEVAEQNQMGEERAIAEAALGEQDRLEGKLARAKIHAERALGLFEEREDPRGTVEMRLLLASIALARHDTDTAARVLDSIGAEIANTEQAAARALRQAELAWEQGNLPEARRLADAAVKTARQSHSVQIAVEAELLMAELVPRPEAGNWLDRAASDLAGFASIPLQMRLHTTRLALDTPGCAADYRQGSALLARVPEFHAAHRFLHAATVCRELPETVRAEARVAAIRAVDALAQGLPPPDQASLSAWRARIEASP